jgi:hypothetical protein
MTISLAERQAILTVLRLGAEHGYGNLMQHMATAWAKSLMDQYGMDEATARKASFLSGYPFAMQADLVERGEWDETGERYRKAAG